MMNGTLESATSLDFKWSPECDLILSSLASSDYVEQDWNKLRDMIKYKLKENIASYLSDPPPPPPPDPPAAPTEPQTASPESASTVTTLSPGVLSTAGAKFPPFPKREENEFVRNEFNSYGRQKTVLTEEEAKEAYEGVCRLMHEFDGHPPFTIQRICELMVRPRQHFKYSGKYLRAVERALLVTSTIDAFPVIKPEDTTTASSNSPFMSMDALKEATTPLFSPIPFLHEDARRSRSRSRSPPMSPLSLATTAGAKALSPSSEPLSLGPAADVSGAGAAADTPVLGLVDELDDPGPGHLSDHPTAISSTTTSTTHAESQSTGGVRVQASTATPAGKPLFGGSLQERFVKSTRTEGGSGEVAFSTSSATSVPTPSGGPGAAESDSNADHVRSAEAAKNSGDGAGAESESDEAMNTDSAIANSGSANADTNDNNMSVDESDADKENVNIPKS